MFYSRLFCNWFTQSIVHLSFYCQKIVENTTNIYDYVVNYPIGKHFKINEQQECFLPSDMKCLN